MLYRPVTTQTAAAALSLASLSLSSSPPPQGQNLASLVAASDAMNGREASLDPYDGLSTTSSMPIPISHGKGGKKRGMEHKCESCSKVDFILALETDCILIDDF